MRNIFDLNNLKNPIIYFFPIFIVLAVIFSLIAKCHNNKINQEMIQVSLKGKIEDLRFDEKKYPIAKIRGVWYQSELGVAPIDMRDYIQIGDSVVKNKGEGKYLIYREVNGTWVEKEFVFYENK